MAARPVVILGEELVDDARRWLATRAEVRAIDHASREFADALRSADALVVRTHTIVDDRLLAGAPRLRVVGRAGVGLDNIDVSACRRRGIEVVHTPAANTQAVVEYVFALILGTFRPLWPITAALDLSSWKHRRAEISAPRQLSELTLGILGLGRIGSRLAHAASALGMTLRYNDLREIAPAVRSGAAPCSVSALFATSDVLSIHVDGRCSNRGFVDAALLDRMKPDVTLINTSRGFVVDNVALAAFLQRHPHSRAQLDVHEPEPFDESYPLLSLPNAHLYPHLAARTRRAVEAMSWVVKDVANVLEGRAPEHPAPRDGTPD